MTKSIGITCLTAAFVMLPMSVAIAAEPIVNALKYPGPAWSPYWVGAAIGMLSWLTFYFSNKPIGASSFYAHIAGFLGKIIAPRRTSSLAYFTDNPPRVNWGFAFVIGILVGGALAAVTGGEFSNEWLPPLWVERFGESITLRGSIAFGGGILMAVGARLAGGCTSGHGISGTMQMNPASWIAVICLFVGAISVAIPLFNM